MSKFSKAVRRLRKRYDCDWPHCVCSGIDTCEAKAEKTGCALTQTTHTGGVRPARSIDEMIAEQDRQGQMFARSVSSSTLANGYTPTCPTGGQNEAAILENGKWWVTSYPPRKQACFHPGAKRVYSIGASELYIAAMSDLPDNNDAALIVQCFASTFWGDAAPTLPPRYASLAAHVLDKPDTIILPWRDGSAPTVKPTFWPELVRLLPPGKVIFVCQGGHGRSGTALASVLMSHFKGTAKWAVGLVRNAHCEEAIETKSQMDYLDGLEAWIAANDPAPTITEAS